MSDGQNPADGIEIGQVFEGKYRILRELGRGGFGMVYLAYQENMDRYVALKALKPGASQAAASAKERFLREVRIIAKLKHPNTVTIHDFGTSPQGHMYMLLEYVEGETLKQVLKRDGPQDALRVSDLARQIARSLAEAHKHGVVHRDLKPANIMITNIESEKDFVKVLDFGVARLLDPKTSDLTSVGLPEGERELIGTPRYMSPEQVRGESLTGASDIYSLGLILYEMMCGEPAVQGETTMALITQQISPEPLRMPHLPTFDPMVQDIVRIATAKAVQDRFQTAEQVAEALESVTFNIRRQRNLTGSQSNDMIMQSYQSQLTNMDGRNLPSGQHPSVGNWQSPTPSGQFVDSGYYTDGPPQSHQFQHQYPPQGAGSGQYPQAHGSGQYPHAGSGQYPAANPHQYPPNASGYNTQPPGQMAPIPANPYQSGLNQNPFQTGGGIPVPPPESNDGFPIDRNSEFEDFQQTTERDALDPAMLTAARKAYQSGEMPSFSDLPPPPVDDRPFEEPPEIDQSMAGPAPQVDEGKRPAMQRPRPPANEDDLMAFSLGVVKVLLIATVAGFLGYVAFLVVGALLGDYMKGSWRLIGSVIAVATIPLMSALGETSQRERFRVVTRPLDRATKVVTATLVFFIGACLLASLVSADSVVGGLRKDPNWFLTEPESNRGLPAANRELSYMVSDFVAGSMGAIGMYNDRRVVPKGKVGPTRTPMPTRQNTKEEAPKSEAPRKGTPDKKSDYVKW